MTLRLRNRYCAYLLLLAPSAAVLAAKPEPISPRECLVLRRTDQSRRAAIHTDAVEAQIVAGTWTAPRDGDELRGPGGKVSKWEKIELGKDGGFAHKALDNG